MICKKCGKDFPATPEYFHRTKSHGVSTLRTQCKSCVKLYYMSDRVKDNEAKRRQAESYKVKRKEYRQSERGQSYQKAYHYQYDRTDKYRLKDKARGQTERRRAWKKQYTRRYQRTEKNSNYRRLYRVSPVGYAKRKTNDERRRATKLSLPNTLSSDQWQNALNYFNHRCAACGRPAGLWHTLAMDHWIPLSDPNCPGTVVGNIIPLCHGIDGCNNSKHNADPNQWLIDKFGKRVANQIAIRVQSYLSSVEE